MNKKKYSKYIKRAYKYYAEQTSICPDAEDIANDVASQIEDMFGIDISDATYNQILKEITGE